MLVLAFILWGLLEARRAGCVNGVKTRRPILYINVRSDYTPKAHDERLITRWRYTLAQFSFKAYVNSPGATYQKPLSSCGYGLVTDCMTIEVPLHEFGFRLGRVGAALTFPTGFARRFHDALPVCQPRTNYHS